jgi:hypothetical protein
MSLVLVVLQVKVQVTAAVVIVIVVVVVAATAAAAAAAADDDDAVIVDVFVVSFMFLQLGRRIKIEDFSWFGKLSFVV